MIYNKELIKSNLIILSNVLNIDPPKNIKSFVDYISKNFSSEKVFMFACRELEKNWTKQSFPKPADFFNSFKEMKVEHQEHIPEWRKEYAAKLGIHVDQLPVTGWELTPEQRDKLDMYQPEEYKRQFKIILDKLDGVGEIETQPINEYPTEEEYNKSNELEVELDPDNLPF